MAHSKQLLISLDGNTHIQATLTAEEDHVKVAFSTGGYIIPKRYAEGDNIIAFGISHDAGTRWRLKDNAYFSPHIADDVVITLHVAERKKKQYTVTFNAYRKIKTGNVLTKLEYLGSKIETVEFKK